MGFYYTVVQGDCLSSIAQSNGFKNYRTVYDAPENAAFRALRPNPNLIYSGDEVFIPAKDLGGTGCGTEKRHRFRLSRWPTRLRVILTDDDDQPYASMPYTLTVDGFDEGLCGTTTGSGMVDHSIPPDATSAIVELSPCGDVKGDPRIWVFALGSLDPVEKLSGVQARLNNLGFDSGDVDGIDGPITQAAVKAFQKKYHLAVDGEAGPVTRGKLKQAYGC